MKLFSQLLKIQQISFQKTLRAKRKEDMVVQHGKEQLKTLVKKGLAIPVVLL